MITGPSPSSILKTSGLLSVAWMRFSVKALSAAYGTAEPIPQATRMLITTGSK
jgi:hypothetical protein